MSLYTELARRLLEGDFNYAFNISLKNKYVYVENAKAACTILKSILAEWEFADHKLGADIPAAFLKNVHVNVIGTPFVKPFQLGQSLFDSILQSDEYFRFSFVRNPYTRLLSAYLDKILRLEPEAEHVLREAAALGLAQPSQTLSFTDFLKCVESLLTRRSVDKHWRPQAFQLYPEAIRYDFIGKVEEFADGIAHVAAALGRPVPDTRRTYGHETRAAAHVAEYYTDEASQLLLKLYAADFDHFGYDKRPPTA